MKSKMNIKSIMIMAIVGIISMFFINMSLAANTGKINVETANIRETADKDAKILKQISMNEEVEIIEKVGEWYKVKSEKVTGYIRQDLVTENEELAQSNTTSSEETIENKENEGTKTTQQEQNTELGKRKVIEDTKLKILPVINATDIIEVKKDQEVNVTEVINGWACIEVETTKGWIRKEKLIKEEQVQQVTSTVQTVIKTLFINSTTVNLRKEANTTSEVVTKLTVNTSVDVLAEANGWSQVKVNGKEGYILSSLLSTNKQETSRSSTIRTATTKETTKKENNNTQTTTNTTQTTEVSVSGNGLAVVSYAKQFIGTKYTYGGSTPATGFDCSGFTAYVYQHFGVNLPHSSGGQGSVGTAVSKSDLAPGDLVIYSGHVAIYVGGGQVIHAPRTGKTVSIVPLEQAKPGAYIGARRVI